MDGRKRVLLINPKCDSDFLNTSVMNKALKKTSFFPSLSILTIAALTPEDKFDVRVFDENLGKDLDEKDVRDADICGLTAFDPNSRRAHHLCRMIKRAGKYVVLGGPYVSQHYKEMNGHLYDSIFIGEAEYTWPRFLGEFLDGKQSDIYIQDEKVDFHDSPIPRWDLCPTRHFLTGLLQCSRGCPFSCEFCDAIVLYGNRVRTKSVDQIIRELDILYRIGFQSILIGDDNFTADRKFAKNVLRRIIEWRRDKDPLFTIGTQASIDMARDDELLTLMIRAGLRFVYIGIETPNKDTLKRIKKLQNVKSDMEADIEKINSYGINIMSGLIVGFDEDDASVFNRNAEFCDRLGVPVTLTYILSAPLGTPLYRRVQKEKRLVGDYTIGELFKSNITPKNMSAEEMDNGFRRMTANIFSDRAFIGRVKKKFKTFNSRGLSPEGRMSPPSVFRVSMMGWNFTSYIIRHPQDSSQLTKVIIPLLSTMLPHGRFAMDMLQDVMIFVRFKEFYRREGLIPDEAPQQWLPSFSDTVRSIKSISQHIVKYTRRFSINNNRRPKVAADF